MINPTEEKTFEQALVEFQESIRERVMSSTEMPHIEDIIANALTIIADIITDILAERIVRKIIKEWVDFPAGYKDDFIE